ncbi:hypothetical protein CE143_16730 [Photorhabdus luminescens]|uniref:Uncharacterized protein n=1 Tax=Photorhabdus akhurstii TaxID=171438 RepID=A0ABX8M0H0_9GAMM|nr:hypothetical protein B0X70_16735 [Photorhabdus akhurstii]UJD76449.1 hypothetical protein CE143_16730 [Photorhabdus luminescens]
MHKQDERFLNFPIFPAGAYKNQLFFFKKIRFLMHTPFYHRYNSMPKKIFKLHDNKMTFIDKTKPTLIAIK